MRIKQLSSLLANQIAAGEVIERPASVLKELLENSLDAAADKIDVFIESGGSQLIQVRDNGNGIYQEDLKLAFSQHATSKIYEPSDLMCISSLGFRGEALASIAAVSEMEIISKPKLQELAYAMSNANFISIPTNHLDGTTIKVKNLFYNIPVGRKFLSSERTEYIHLEEIFKHIVLSHFYVKFSLTHNGKTRYILPACSDAKKQQRVAKILGERMLMHALYIDVEQNGLRLWGWLGMPKDARSTTEYQFFYLNKRIIKDRMVNHAIKTSYREYLTLDRHATYCLYLDIDPSMVDVNVHPTKYEIRFRDSRTIYSFLGSAIQHALKQALETKFCPIKSTKIRELSDQHNLELQNFNIVVEAILKKGKFIFAKIDQTQFTLIDTKKAKIYIYIQELKKMLANCDNILYVDKYKLSPAVIIQLSNNVDLTKILASLQWLNNIGFEIIQIGAQQLSVNSIPQNLQGLRPTEDFLYHFASQAFDATVDIKTKLVEIEKVLIKFLEFDSLSIPNNLLNDFVYKASGLFRNFSLQELL